MDKHLENALAASELAQLREVLTPTISKDVDTLKLLMSDDERLTERVSEILPKLFNPKDKDNKRLPHSMQNSVLESLSFAASAEPKRVAQVLSPALLPAINHAIGKALLDFRASIDEMMRNYLSPKGLWWRFQSWRSGDSFSKIARQKSASFGIEAVVFVHKQTKEILYTQYTNTDIEHLIKKHEGEFLSHCQSLSNTAVVTEASSQVMMHRLLIGGEQIPLFAAHGAWMSTLVLHWGEVPSGYFEQFVSVLQRAQAQNQHELSHRKLGQESMTALALPSSVLVRLGDSTGKSESGNNHLGFMVLAIVFLSGLIFYAWTKWQLDSEKQKLATFMAQQSSWVTQDLRYEKGQWQVQGLLDRVLLTEQQISAAWQKHHPHGHELVVSAKPYVSLNSDAVLQRAKQSLKPPKDIKLALVGERLSAQGTLAFADRAWLADAAYRAQSLLGIMEFDTSAVKTLEDPAALVLAPPVSPLK